MPARKPYYILFDDDQLNINLDFTQYKVQVFDEMWDKGYSIEEIAKKLQRKRVEVELLAADRFLREKIKVRKGCMEGTFTQLKGAK